MCHGVCGVLVHLENGKVVKVSGDPECPTSRGYICSKGKASVELLYHPERLQYPLKRAGERGENKWQRISWDEALDTVSDKLLRLKAEFGAESIAGAYGTGRPYYVFFHRFLNSLGTPNRVTFAHVCYAPRLAASAMTCGTLPVCDYYGFGGTTPKCVVVWGCNITETGASDGMCGNQLSRTIKGGARLIVIDPRRTEIASKADHWVQLRPGTDDAVAMGMLNTIIEEGLYDRDFVANWTVGFDELAERAKRYPAERMAEIAWVPAETIREAARAYAATKPACIQWGVAIDQNINSFQTIRAILLLSGITGNIDVPGGDVFWVPPEGVVIQAPRLNPEIVLPGRLSPEALGKKIGAGRYRVLPQVVHPRDFWDAVLTENPYPVKALFLMGTNTFLGHSYTERMAAAFKKIDFTVASELFMTPTAQMADILLPAASWLETDDVADVHFVWCVLVRQKAATIGECRDDKDILIDLARRMGMEECFPWKNVRDYCDWVLRDSNVTFEEFKEKGVIQGRMQYRKHLRDGFRTASGRFELRCSRLAALGYDPLPSVVEPPESPYSTPDLLGRYPLIITTGARIQPFFHTEGRQIPSLRKRNPDPLLEIHPATAASLGVEDGDWVWIESPRGRIRQRARLTEDVDPRVVSAQHGWWFPESSPPDYGFRESSVSMLTADIPCDPHTGSESWRSFLCRVYKA
jgi:anaerobic selenocysteine-containing dehydrogenase